MQYDSRNVDLYLGLEEAMERAGRTARESDAGDFDEAEKQLANRFFPREEGGANVREIYVALKLKRAKSIAAQGRCPSALDIVRHLREPVAGLPFTSKGLEPFLSSAASKQAVEEIQARCR